MELSIAKEKFITEWGELAVNWGANRTIGQIHALLLVSDIPMCTNQIMEVLSISRGNVNMNMRTLLDWGVVHKQTKDGGRKEYFEGERDIWKVFRLILEQRKKKELDPLMTLLENLSAVEANCTKTNHFCNVVDELKLYAKNADNAMNTIIGSETNWLTSNFLNLMR